MKLTGKQSRTARALLKWNLHDLAARVHTGAKRIENFENGIVHLQKFENEELVETYTKAGIEFRGDFEVVLKGKRREESHGVTEAMQINVTQEELDQMEAKELTEEEAEAARKQKRI